MMFILLFGGAILIGVDARLHRTRPARTISLGHDDAVSVQIAALLLGHVVVVHAARHRDHGSSSARSYVMNVGLDEVFNPRLREL